MCLNSVMEYSGPEVLQWLKSDSGVRAYTFTPENLSTKSCNTAARIGSIDWFEWFVDNGCLVDENTYTYAAVNNRFDMLKYLRSKKYPWNHMTFHGAAISGNVEMMQWLQDEGCPWSNSVFTGAMEGGHLPVLKFLMDGDYKITL